MISRRKFLAGAIAAAVAPSVAPAPMEFGRLDTFRFVTSNQTVMASSINEAMSFGVGHVAMPAHKAEQHRKNKILRAMMDNLSSVSSPGQ